MFEPFPTMLVTGLPYRRLTGFGNRNLFLIVLEAGKAKTKVPR